MLSALEQNAARNKCRRIGHERPYYTKQICSVRTAFQNWILRAALSCPFISAFWKKSPQSVLVPWIIATLKVSKRAYRFLSLLPLSACASRCVLLRAFVDRFCRSFMWHFHSIGGSTAIVQHPERINYMFFALIYHRSPCSSWVLICGLLRTQPMTLKQVYEDTEYKQGTRRFGWQHGFQI